MDFGAPVNPFPALLFLFNRKSAFNIQTAAFPTPSQNDKCCGGSLHAICHTSLVLGNLDSDSHFRPLEVRPTVATGSGPLNPKRTQFKSFVHSPSPPTNAWSIWIDAVAAVRLFKVARWRAARMAPRLCMPRLPRDFFENGARDAGWHPATESAHCFTRPGPLG